MRARRAKGTAALGLTDALLDFAIGATITPSNRLLITALAALVCNGTACFAGALAGALSLAAAAVRERFTQARRCNCLKMLH